MKIKRFEDIDVWKESRKLVNVVYDLANKELFKRDFGLREQLRKAAVSCMANVAEGFDSGTNRQFIQMLTYTGRSASEVQSELYIASDRKYITQSEFDKCYKQAEVVRKLSSGLIRYLKKGL